MLTLNSVCIKINNLALFDKQSISFLPGSIIYLKGKNGSGKTSLLRSIAGIQKISEGEITLGKNNIALDLLPKPYCHYIGHKTGIKLELSVYENINFWAKIYNSSEMVEAAIFYFKIQNIIHKKCYSLSAGQRQKVALARLFACNSMIWLLDEVENNLDNENRKLLNNLIISKANNGGIIIASSHNEPAIKSAIQINLDKNE